MKLRISSPGKVILHGEHSVVYQKPALAAVIGLRSQIDLINCPESQVAIFHLDNLACTFEIQLSEVNTFLKDFQSLHPDILENIDTLLEAVRLTVSKKLQISSGGQEENSQQAKAFLSIYYLLCGCFLSSSNEKPKQVSTGFEIRLNSDLKIGAGLGSSASFGVTLAAAFLFLSEQIGIDSYSTEESLAMISQWAFESERIMHGNPSGVDNTVCTYGGIVRFVKGQGFSQLKILKPLNILLVDSKVNRCTATLVAKVGELHQTFPKVVDYIMSALEEVVNEAITLYEEIGKSEAARDAKNFQKLESLFELNNNLLKSIGVSHKKLEEIFSISARNGFSSKLTGAGGGGYGIVLLPDGYESNEAFNNLSRELKDCGFAIHSTTVGGEGLNMKIIN